MASFSTLLSPNPPAAARWIALAALLVACAVAWHVRTEPAHDLVFPEGKETRLLGIDSYFHVRRAERLNETFPEIERIDRETGFPNGMWDDATGLFGLINLGFARLTAGPDGLTTAHLSRVMAWAPPLYGLLSHLLVFVICWMLRGPIAAAAGTGLFLLYPGSSLDYSLLGFADHHALETVLALGVLLGLLFAFDMGRKGRWLRSALGAAPLLLFFVAWRGAPLFLVVAGIAAAALLLIHLATGREMRDSAWATARYFGAFALGYAFLLGAWPTGIVDPWNAYAVWVLAGAAATIAVSLAIPPVVDWLTGSSFGRRAIFGMAAGVLMVSAFAVLQTPAGQSLLEELFEAKESVIMEETDANLAAFLAELGGSAILALLGLLGLAVTAFRRRAKDGEILALIFGAGAVFFWMQANDFAYTPPPLVAVSGVIGLFIWKDLFSVDPAASVSKRRSRGKAKSAQNSVSFRQRVPDLLPAAGLVLAVFPLWPAGSTDLPYRTPEVISRGMWYDDAWFDTAEWLDRYSPESIYIGEDGYRNIVSGIMTSWDFGNIVGSHGKRATVFSRFPKPEEGAWFAMRDEEKALAILCEECQPMVRVSHVVIDDWTAGAAFITKARYGGATVISSRKAGPMPTKHPEVFRLTYGALFEESMAARLYVGDGSGMRHLRLVHESTQESFTAYVQPDGGGQSLGRVSVPYLSEADKPAFQPALEGDILRISQGTAYEGLITSQLKVFEVVEGAKVEGMADPAEEIAITLDLRDSRTGRAFQYRQDTVSGADGRFRFTVPYSTEVNPASGRTIVPEGFYRIVRGASVLADGIAVSDDAVTAGDTVRVELITEATP